MRLTYLHLDVFTATRFGGNQLAVFLDPPVDIATQTMQAIANEMAFAESTFVFPPNRADVDMQVRIFTPAEELPMAGHPTIGTAFALAHSGRLQPETPQTVFGEGVGPVPVALTWKADRLAFAWMTQPRPQFSGTLADVAELAGALGLEASDLAPEGLPVEHVSCGTPYVIVPIATRAAVDRSIADPGRLNRVVGRGGWPNCPVYLFTLERADDEARVYTRMFAPAIGIAEDAATGSASGPLGAYLVKHGRWPAPPGETLLNLQGKKMLRPSWLHIAPIVSGSEVTAVRVGGEAVIVGEGRLTID
jgi:trans-2,3-dihydro-3-hydroxyanthranilate isomerase